MARLAAFAVAFLLASGAFAQAYAPMGPAPMGLDAAASDLPAPLREVGFDQNLGGQLPLDAPFLDSTGNPVVLGDFFGDKPVALTLVYFDCPMLCPMTLDGVARSLKALAFNIGADYEMVVVGFDPSEGPELAAEARQRAIQRYGRINTEQGWHFLTGDEESIRRVAEAVGFRYTWDEERGEFAHAAGLILNTPDGEIARYFFGIDYPPKDLRLGFVEAGSGTIGNPIDQILLYCFHYDAVTGRYTAVTMNIVRIAGLLTVAILVTFIVVMVRREKSKSVTDLRTA